MAHPPAKQRHAKHTEEECINYYLKSDPYISEFEAYCILCASCDKWICLRPNSTYCSIPLAWDAHHKSCLAKKMWVIHPLFIALFILFFQLETTRLLYNFKQEVMVSWPLIHPEKMIMMMVLYKSSAVNCVEHVRHAGVPQNQSQLISVCTDMCNVCFWVHDLNWHHSTM